MYKYVHHQIIKADELYFTQINIYLHVNGVQVNQKVIYTDMALWDVWVLTVPITTCLPNQYKLLNAR